MIHNGKPEQTASLLIFYFSQGPKAAVAVTLETMAAVGAICTISPITVDLWSRGMPGRASG